MRKTKQIPYIKPIVPTWMSRYITKAEAESVCSEASLYVVSVKTLEDEMVFYRARAEDGYKAITGFNKLLIRCRHDARTARREHKDHPMVGYCVARLINEAAEDMANRVMSYLPCMIEEEDRPLLAKVVEANLVKPKQR